MDAEERNLLEEVIRNGFPNEGPLTEKFERAIASKVGAKHALCTTSCTAAMFLSLKALGIGRGDEVVVPDLTFIATANAVEMTGAKVVLADIDPNRLTLSPESFEATITPRTKAVIPVHVTGRAADLGHILDIAEDNSIHVVEDAAEAFGSRHRNQSLGTFGEFGCFSFSPHKTITTGQGGAIVTDDAASLRRVRALKDQGRPTRGTGGDDRHDSIGYNFKFTDLQAAVGLGQMASFRKRVERMAAIRREYERDLTEVEGLRLLPFDLDGGEIPQWTDALVEERDGLDKHLQSLGIECRRFWFPIHTQRPYRLPDKRFPNSTHLSAKALWLPSSFTMSQEEVKIVCEAIRAHLGGTGSNEHPETITGREPNGFSSLSLELSRLPRSGLNDEG